MNWTQEQLADAPVEVIDGDRGKNYPTQNEFLDEGHCLFLSATNVTKDGFAFEKCQFISEEKDNSLRKGRVRRNDIVLTTRGTLGNVAYYSDAVSFDHVRINSGMVTIQSDAEELLPRYLYYFLKSELFQAQVRALQSGAAQPQLPIRDIKKIKISYPDPIAQDCIAGVVGAYDDLIDNNRRRIALLEEVARLLYREWFVHFRFPGHEHVVIVDGIPEGWKPTVLSDLVELVKDTVKPEKFTEEDIHIGLEHIPRRSFTLANWEDTKSLASQKFRFRAGDILFAKIRPYFHKVGIALRDGLVSSDAFVWRAIEERNWALVACATSSDYFVAVASKTVREGSKMPRADWKVLADFTIATPPDHILEDFNSRICPMTSMCRSLALQNRELAKSRDLLLPRLMDGRLEV